MTLFVPSTAKMKGKHKRNKGIRERMKGKRLKEHQHEQKCDAQERRKKRLKLQKKSRRINR
jgi:Flp pilus assembly protein TadB